MNKTNNPREYKFRDLSDLVGFLKVSLLAFTLIALLSLYSTWLEIQLLQQAASGVSITQAQAAANDSRQAVLGLLYLGSLLVTAVLFLRWVYLSNKNAHTLINGNMQSSPGWAVGWFFIPIANLWKPYQAVREIFEASHPEKNKKDTVRPEVVPAWWGLTLTNVALGRIFFREASFSGSSIEEVLNFSWYLFFSDIISALTGIAILVMVGTLYHWQSQKHKA